MAIRILVVLGLCFVYVTEGWLEVDYEVTLTPLNPKVIIGDNLTMTCTRTDTADFDSSEMVFTLTSKSPVNHSKIHIVDEDTATMTFWNFVSSSYYPRVCCKHEMETGEGECQLLHIYDQQRCPAGFQYHERSCYLFSHDSESWVNALANLSVVDSNYFQEQCTDMFHSHLVKIETKAEGDYLATVAAAKNVTYWIGVNDILTEGRWVWGSDANDVITGYANWATGEPNNINANENCAVMNQLGFWYDIPCLYPIPYICEKPAG